MFFIYYNLSKSCIFIIFCINKSELVNVCCCFLLNKLKVSQETYNIFNVYNYIYTYLFWVEFYQTQSIIKCIYFFYNKYLLHTNIYIYIYIFYFNIKKKKKSNTYTWGLIEIHKRSAAVCSSFVYLCVPLCVLKSSAPLKIYNNNNKRKRKKKVRVLSVNITRHYFF